MNSFRVRLAPEVRAVVQFLGGASWVRAIVECEFGGPFYGVVKCGCELPPDYGFDLALFLRASEARRVLVAVRGTPLEAEAMGRWRAYQEIRDMLTRG